MNATQWPHACNRHGSMLGMAVLWLAATGGVIAVVAVVLSLLGILVPLAIAVGAVWLAQRLARWRHRDGRSAPQVALDVGVWQPLDVLRQAAATCQPRAHEVGLHAIETGRRVGGILLEIGSGALSGGALGWAMSRGAAHHPTHFAPIGFLIGAGLGLLIGLANHTAFFSCAREA